MCIRDRPLVLLFLLGYFILQSTETSAPDRAVFFEYSAKCNLWEVRDIHTGNLKSHTTEGIKQVYDLSDTKYAPLIKIDGEIIGYKMDGIFDWNKAISYTFIGADEAKKIYGKDARYGLAEFNSNTEVIAEFKACTTDDDGTDLNGLPLVLYEGCLLYTSPSPRDATLSRMPSSA